MADGFIAYQGSASHSPTYFNKIGFRLTKNANPTDIFMQILSVDYPVTKKGQAKLNKLRDAYNKKFATSIMDQIKDEKVPELDEADQPESATYW